MRLRVQVTDVHRKSRKTKALHLIGDEAFSGFSRCIKNLYYQRAFYTEIWVYYYFRTFFPSHFCFVHAFVSHAHCPLKAIRSTLSWNFNNPYLSLLVNKPNSVLFSWLYTAYNLPLVSYLPWIKAPS